MAEIPVERKEGGLPWWLIPLILLLLLLVALFLYRGCSSNNNGAVVGNTNGNSNRGSSVTATNTNTVNSTGAMTQNNTAVVVNNNSGGGSSSNTSGINAGSSTGGTITDVEYFGGTTDQGTLAGRSVDFSSARVNRVVSDRVFTVKSGKGEFFVMLDDSLNAGDKEHQIQIKPGQNLKLGGEFRNVPTAEVNDEKTNRDLNQKNYAQMKNQKIYLHATGVSEVK